MNENKIIENKIEINCLPALKSQTSQTQPKQIQMKRRMAQ